jgi:hypothetical protein
VKLRKPKIIPSSPVEPVQTGRRSVPEVVAELAAKGDSDAQAAYLTELVEQGVIYRGTQLSCSLCALALYLRRFSDAFWLAVAVMPEDFGPSVIRYQLRLETGIVREHELPDEVRELALRFDAGDFPGLIDPNTLARSTP